MWIQEALAELHLPLAAQIVEDDIIALLEAADGSSLPVDQDSRLQGFIIILPGPISGPNRLSHGVFLIHIPKFHSSRFFFRFIFPHGTCLVNSSFMLLLATEFLTCYRAVVRINLHYWATKYQ